jgi:hypothetical protein
MSSISCWTSATRCSNSSVSHPTSNSYPPSTFCWSIHRWKHSSPLSVFACPAPSRLAFDQGFGRSVCVFGSLELQSYGNWGLQPGQKKALRGRRHRSHKARVLWPTAGSTNCSRLLSYFPLFVYPYTLSLACSVSAFNLTSTSPIRHAPRRSRDLPRYTPSQASDDVQCHVGEGYPGDV